MKIYTIIKRILLSILLIFNIAMSMFTSSILIEYAAPIIVSIATGLTTLTIESYKEKQREAMRRNGIIDKNIAEKIFKEFDSPNPLVDGKFTEKEREMRKILLEHYNNPVKAGQWVNDCEKITLDLAKIGSNNQATTVEAVYKIITADIPKGIFHNELTDAQNYIKAEFLKGTLFENIEEINNKLYHNLYSKMLRGESYIRQNCYSYGMKFPPAVLPNINEQFLKNSNNKALNSLLKSNNYQENSKDHSYNLNGFSKYFKSNKIDSDIIQQVAKVIRNYESELNGSGLLKKDYSNQIKNILQQVDDSKMEHYDHLQKLVRSFNLEWQNQAPIRLFYRVKTRLDNHQNIGYLTRNFKDPVAETLINQNLNDVLKGMLNIEHKIADRLKIGIINREDSLKRIQSYYGQVPKNLTKEENLWLYVIAEAQGEKSLQHELIQTVYSDFNTRQHQKIYNFFYDQNGLMKKYSDNPLLKNIDFCVKLNEKQKRLIVPNINRLLFLQENYTPGSDEYSCLQESIRDLTNCLKTGDLTKIESSLKPLGNPCIRIKDKNKNSKPPLDRILDDVKHAYQTKPMKPEDIIKRHDEIWQDIEDSVDPILILRHYAQNANTLEANDILNDIAILRKTDLPRFIIEDYVFAAKNGFDTCDVNGNKKFRDHIRDQVQRIRRDGIKDPLEYALYRDKKEDPKPKGRDLPKPVILGKPTEGIHKYKPPKNDDGKKKKHPKSGGYGWIDKDGNYWIPDKSRHGGDHWDVIDKNGNKIKDVYLNGHVRYPK